MLLNYSMSNSTDKCAVCGRLTSLFNYGAHSCSACGSFFRRCLTTPRYFEDCGNHEQCFKDFSRAVHSDCKFCRFHKCILVGMLTTSRFSHLTKIIGNLALMDTKREYAYINMIVPDNFRPDELLKQGSVKLTQKPAGTVFDCHDWGFMNQITIIEYLKKLDFTKFLSSQDHKSYLTTVHFTHVILTSAWRSYNLKQDFMSFPDGVDIFPESVKSVSCISPHLQNRIRCLLINRFKELKLTNEEYLLLCAIVFSNPGFSSLSDTGRTMLGAYQNVFCSSLFQYCTSKYQQNAHTRFHELLSVFNVVTKTYEDIKKYLILFQYSQPNEQPKQMYMEVLQLLNYTLAEMFTVWD
ncbi:unnamed protein product [Caenorhabditis brenneri]